MAMPLCAVLTACKFELTKGLVWDETSVQAPSELVKPAQEFALWASLVKITSLRGGKMPYYLWINHVRSTSLVLEFTDSLTDDRL